MTKCRFALYDPARPSPGGSYWAWCAEGLDVDRLDRLYYDAAVKHRPSDPNHLSPDDIWGGIAELDDDLVGVYRYFDGARDLHGRPGRFVILATLLARDDVRDRDLSLILRCETARWVAHRAPKACPLPAPPSLQEDIELPAAVGDEELTRERFDFIGHDAIGRAGRLFGSLPAGMGWRCVIQSTHVSASRSSIYRDDSASRSPADARDNGPMGASPGTARKGQRSFDRVPDEASVGRIGSAGPKPWSLRAVLVVVRKALWGPRPSRLHAIFSVLLLSALLVLIAFHTYLFAVRYHLNWIAGDPSSVPAGAVVIENQPDPSSVEFKADQDGEDPRRRPPTQSIRHLPDRAVEK